MSKDDHHKGAEAGAKQGSSGQRDAQGILIGQKLYFFRDTVIFSGLDQNSFGHTVHSVESVEDE